MARFHQDTPPKFNIAPEKWWLEDYFWIFWEGLFSGAMLNFGRVSIDIPQSWLPSGSSLRPRPTWPNWNGKALGTWDAWSKTLMVVLKAHHTGKTCFFFEWTKIESGYCKRCEAFCQMILDGLWWSMMVYDNLSWFLMVYDLLQRFIRVNDGLWWFIVVYCGFWWFHAHARRISVQQFQQFDSE